MLEADEEFKDLKLKVFYIEELLKFHNLYEIPSKYKKAFPKEFENPFYEVKGIKKNPHLRIFPISSIGIENTLGALEEIPDIKEREESKKRMWEYYQHSLTIENPNLLKEKLQKEHDPWPPFHKGD